MQAENYLLLLLKGMGAGVATTATIICLSILIKDQAGMWIAPLAGSSVAAAVTARLKGGPEAKLFRSILAAIFLVFVINSFIEYSAFWSYIMPMTAELPSAERGEKVVWGTLIALALIDNYIGTLVALLLEKQRA